MLSIHKISPMLRAVGTMGAVAAVVGGVTFANLTSNTVALTNNQLASETASLAIADGTTCPDALTTTADGMTFTNLKPGVESSAFDFCLRNKGTSDLNISMTSPTDLSSTTLPLALITLKISCDGQTPASVTLNNLTAPTVITPTAPVLAGATEHCAATAKLDSSYSGSGGSVPAFTLNFVGTSV